MVIDINANKAITLNQFIQTDGVQLDGNKPQINSNLIDNIY